MVGDVAGNAPKYQHVVILAAADYREGWAVTLGSLQGEADLVVAWTAPSGQASLWRSIGDWDIEPSVAPFAELVAEAAREAEVLTVVTAPIRLPNDSLARALSILADDVRVASVSLLTDWGGDTSLNSEFVNRPPLPHDLGCHAITETLREAGWCPGVVRIPSPTGPVVLLSASAVRATWDPFVKGEPEEAIADFSNRSLRRNFRHVLDLKTCVSRIHRRGVLSGPANEPRDSPRLEPWAHAHWEELRTTRESPFRSGLRVASAALRGLRIGIDGSALGPHEMGTQVQTLSLIDGLVAHEGVDTVYVALPGPIPEYARRTFDDPRVSVAVYRDGVIANCPPVDVFHRPFQPDRDLPVSQWRSFSDRISMTILDLIAYDNGSYFPSSTAWLDYRKQLRRNVQAADGAIAISQDVLDECEDALLLGGLVAEAIPLGTDHPLSLGPVRPPRKFAGEWAAVPFILVLGADYAHKNRDLAVRAWSRLRGSGLAHRLVLAGVHVPFGSTMDDEEVALRHSSVSRKDCLILPDVSSEERLWLLEHADLVLYPTSAEGFGLVPHEAARSGTPTLFVPFGPLAEHMPVAPAVHAGWDEETLSEAIRKLLTDRRLMAEQVAAIQSAQTPMWSEVADRYVTFFRRLLTNGPRIEVLPDG